MTVGMFLWMLGALATLIAVGFVGQIVMESWSENQVQPENRNLNFAKLLAQHESIPTGVAGSFEDTGVIRVRDMARVFADQDADIGRDYVESLKQRLILTGAYS